MCNKVRSVFYNSCINSVKPCKYFRTTACVHDFIDYKLVFIFPGLFSWPNFVVVSKLKTIQNAKIVTIRNFFYKHLAKIQIGISNIPTKSIVLKYNLLVS